jgi:hypothetical protein
MFVEGEHAGGSSWAGTLYPMVGAAGLFSTRHARITARQRTST